MISINVFPSILLTFSVGFDIYLFILYLKIQKIKNIFFLKNRNVSNLFSQITLSLSLSLFNSSSNLKLSLFDNKVKLYLLKWQALVVHGGEREREFALVCGGAWQESSGSANDGVLGVELRSGVLRWGLDLPLFFSSRSL